MSAGDWTPTSRALPRLGEVVEVMSESGHVTTLMVGTTSGLWFVPDGSMYVYWAPKFWRRIDGGAGSTPGGEE